MEKLDRNAAETIARDGIAALRAGDGATASQRLSRVIADAPDGYPKPWFLLAQAARLTGDDRVEKEALQRHLDGEPRHLGALLLMAENRMRAGDDRGASTFYQTARAVAEHAPATVTAALAPMLSRGDAFLAESARRFEAHLMAQVRSAGLDKGAAGARIRESLDLLAGRSELYFQQPSMFYFPGLPQCPFYERADFDWLPALEAATGAIREELVRADKHGGFSPYVEATPDRPLPANRLLDDPSWSALYLWRGGEVVAEHAARFPATLAALDATPRPVVPGRSPIALFSRLAPGTHIQPHHGLLNTRLICHLPLIVPDGCGIRVGAETRTWREGEALIFDDSIEHEAWNHGTSARTVLIFEVWRPELTADERDALVRIFTTIDAYRGAAVDAG